MLRVCLDLNVWLGAFLSEKLGRTETATQTLVDAVRTGVCEQGPVSLIVSWGMLNRLQSVLTEQGFDAQRAIRLIEVISTYAREGPSLTLGGIGVLPLDDEEDRHVLETAFAGRADLLVMQNLRDFAAANVQTLVENLAYGAARGVDKILILHTNPAAAWFRGERLAPQIDAFKAPLGPVQG
jgi:predicted nucleic acid-binding protein